MRRKDDALCAAFLEPSLICRAASLRDGSVSYVPSFVVRRREDGILSLWVEGSLMVDIFIFHSMILGGLRMLALRSHNTTYIQKREIICLIKNSVGKPT